MKKYFEESNYKWCGRSGFSWGHRRELWDFRKCQQCMVQWNSKTMTQMERSNQERTSEYGKESRMESNKQKGRTRNRRLLRAKWVFKVKQNGSFKARLVIQAFLKYQVWIIRTASHQSFMILHSGSYWSCILNSNGRLRLLILR